MNFAQPAPVAAAIAFIALGATLLGTGLLLLINPRSRSVRWHAAFSVMVMAWLGLQGWFALGRGGAGHTQALGIVVHMMPAFFVAAALVEAGNVRNRMALAVLAVAAVSAVWFNPMTGSPLATAWQAVMWGVGGLRHYFTRAGPTRRHGGKPGPVALRVALLLIVPIGVIGVLLLRGAFLLYLLPLMMVGIQFLIFIGVVHHRFYDIEVRAARSGDLASKAAEHERLALLGELSATLAHEIRNPLTGMRSLTQRLGEPLPDERRTRYVEVVLGEIARLDRIAGSLLDVSRRNAVSDDRTASTPLDSLFDDVVLLVDGRAARAGVSLARHAAGATVAAPRDALAQVLLNLIINGIQHTPAGGVVKLSAERHDSTVYIRVHDGGPGIPPEQRERIFEPFHTRGIGTGLGLAVVRRIVRELDWQIQILDAPEGGALFELQLPAAASSAASSAAASAPGSAAGGDAAADDASFPEPAPRT